MAIPILTATKPVLPATLARSLVHTRNSPWPVQLSNTYCQRRKAGRERGDKTTHSVLNVKSEPFLPMITAKKRSPSKNILLRGLGTRLDMESMPPPSFPSLAVSFARGESLGTRLSIALSYAQSAITTSQRVRVATSDILFAKNCRTC